MGHRQSRQHVSRRYRMDVETFGVIRRGTGRLNMATKRICTVEGCDGKQVGKGLCGKHWQRMKTHGDPTKTIMRARGEGNRGPMLCNRIKRPHDQDEACL
jgi:hypothetical protein